MTASAQKAKTAKPTRSDLDRLLFALNHPIRRRILVSLLGHPGSATTLSQEFGLKQSRVSYHLNDVLANECEVVELLKIVRHRGAKEKVYTVRIETINRLLAAGRDLPQPVHLALNGLSTRGFIEVLSVAVLSGSTNPLPGSALEWNHVAVEAEYWPAIRDAAQHFLKTVSDAAIVNGKGGQSAHNLLVGIAAVPLPGTHSAEALSP